MKKRFVCCLLVISILLVAALPITADLEVTENGLPFIDFEAGKWYSDAVMYVYEKGIMEGKSDNTFAPNEGMTRAQIVTVFYRLAEAYEKGLGKRLEFSDVEKNAWYSDYLGWAVQEELVSGYPEGDFRPGASVTRQELAKLIVEFLGYVLAKPETDSDIGDFSDKDTFPVWSAEYIEELRGYGIVVGDQNGNFNPYNSVTRAEIAIIIQRIMPAVEEALKPLPPIMGWSSWNCLGIFDLSEEALIAQMDAMINLGLNDVGYEYINIDDTWQYGRDETTGRVNYNEERFPSGMKYIADEAHRRGLKAGLYTDIGNNTCGSGDADSPLGGKYGIGVGLFKNEEDLWMYLGDGVYEDDYARETSSDGVECWGFDFIKVDSCGLGDTGTSAEKLHTEYYNVVKKIEREFGKNKIYNMCRWFYDGPYLLRIGDSWRSGVDLFANFKSISTAIEKQKRIGIYTMPGHYGDLDMLQVGHGMTPEEDRTHFAMWCMFSSPLVLGCDLRTIDSETLDLVKNTELIAINQDVLGKSAAYIKTYGDSTELWFKKTVDKTDGSGAIALYNKGDTEQTVTINLADLCNSGKAEMRDLFAHSDLGEKSTYTVTIAPHDTLIFTINTDEGYLKDCFDVYGEVDIDYDVDIYEEYGIDVERDTIDAQTAKRYLDRSAFEPMLIDVRSAGEYENGHLEGAVNIEYKSLVVSTDLLPVNQEAYLIVYCSAGKRSTQAYYELKRLRYKNVFILDDMNSY